MGEKIRIVVDLRKKGKVEKAMEFAERMRKVQEEAECYKLKSLELDKRTTLVLSNTRELNRELFYKLVYLI